MRPGLGQHTQLKQELKINPRLYQAMDLLYMPLLDLQQHLKQELLNNPFLDMIEPDEEDEEEGEAPQDETNQETEAEKEEKGEIDWEEILLDGFDAGGRREEHEEREYYEPVTVDSRDLSDHLRDQVTLLDLNGRQMFLAEEFIGNINEDGYLACGLEKIVEGANDEVRKAAEETEREVTDLPVYTIAEAEEMLGVIQSLDPPGVGARDLRECLMLQLREAGLEHSVPYRLVRDCFDELIAHRWSEISKRFGISPADVQKAADEIAKLDPKPGLVYSDASDNYIIPDLIVDKIDGKYHVFLNDANLPRLKLSKAYQEIARDKKKFDGENKEFISNKLNSANWMIQAIEQRRQTMLKVMNYIVERQREFFEKGVQYLKPLTLREVAEVINMHESTVSRVTNEKFVQTPRGVLPLKFFFSSGLSTTAGEDVSARGIKAQIQKLVADENPKHPLTDQAIVNILKETGVQIARRTVAKYRDQLGVLSARMRKRV
ncbi:MAG: RNA polymerase factor sigma-54 [Gemmatimonadaceae bacterium]|nr:RNA polymerase factor sigma-54 [Gemmatimonadaceae bacterium]NUO94071.1 RNA polymerase factor sigma-54 [Gemmatimonadaceae bacterium]NUP72316.1 RNA polymerase factor sigma-54 [Gemmatimonadaceae bacterium]NUR34723.1 RNA polymerase factor sigma-54 [Gemmatimonadaceae bacterium]NUS33277.1 RNA polymerase factor sigma-54 [Gemmatimonadaceae bacterium]